jgi:hypothetical protein
MYTQDITGDVPNMLTAPESALPARDSICRDRSRDILSGIGPRKIDVK